MSNSSLSENHKVAFEPLLDDGQAAQLLGIHPKTLQRLARDGQVPAHRVGRFWRYRASELDAWLGASMNLTNGGVQLNRQPARV
jgi:excisionase family DNA binding protein